MVILTVPIHVTESVIKRLEGRLPEHVILADFTSNKRAPIDQMKAIHSGPILGLHPMHGGRGKIFQSNLWSPARFGFQSKVSGSWTSVNSGVCE